MNTYKITDAVAPLADEIKLGDKVELTNQTQDVVACEQTGVKMLNIDANQLKPGDLSFIKKVGLTISNPETDKPIALGVDYTPESFGNRLSDWLTGAAIGGVMMSSDDDNEDDDDDSSFFSSGGSFVGGFSGGFGGLGGGSFSGGGASSEF